MRKKVWVSLAALICNYLFCLQIYHLMTMPRRLHDPYPTCRLPLRASAVMIFGLAFRVLDAWHFPTDLKSVRQANISNSRAFWGSALALHGIYETSDILTILILQSTNILIAPFRWVNFSS